MHFNVSTVNLEENKRNLEMIKSHSHLIRLSTDCPTIELSYDKGVRLAIGSLDM